MIRTDYSKPSLDIKKEESERIANESELVDGQNKAVDFLKKHQDRKKCLLCGDNLKGEKFDHRGLIFVLCGKCGHIQTKINPPAGYPFIPEAGYKYKHIYPQQNFEEYKGRMLRIYKPKLDWAISCLNEIGYNNDKLKSMQWTEIGCGGGYFLAALKDFGVKKFIGIDMDADLVKFAQEKLGDDKVTISNSNKPEEIVAKYPADIYTAFFVFEHFENSYSFFSALKNLPAGTIIIFSVPLFGLTSLLENIFVANYARSLNGIVHTQAFTDKSINYALNLAGFEMIAQWIFGQDANDLTRIMINHVKNKLPKSIQRETINKIITLIDPIQANIDRANFSDQRHFIIKKI